VHNDGIVLLLLLLPRHPPHSLSLPLTPSHSPSLSLTLRQANREAPTIRFTAARNEVAEAAASTAALVDGFTPNTGGGGG